MVDVIRWLVTLEVFGLIGWPLAHRLFAALPSRGYAFAKPLGLLLVGYGFWILGSFHFLMNTTVAVVFVCIGIAAVSAYVGWIDRAELRAFWQHNRSLILSIEAVLVGFYALWAIYRAYNPDIAATEKPMDFLFLNSMLRSPDFPPLDPWLSGYAISYYYFGYLLMSVLARLSGAVPAVAFNLALAAIMGLAASGAYAIVYDMIHLNRQPTNRMRLAVSEASMGARQRPHLVAPLFGVCFLVVVANFEGVLEMLNSHGIGSPEIYSLFQIKDFPPTYDSPLWTPSDNWWWWRASRVVTDTINEFPFFSFLIADLHPHVMALPFVLMSIGLALDQLLTQSTRRTIWLYPILLGALGFLNSWDFPTYGGVVIVAFAISRYRTHGVAIRLWLDLARFVLIVGGLGVLAYLPFYLTFSSQASGVRLLGLFEQRTSLAHLLLFWGFFLFVVLTFVGSQRGTLSMLLRESRARWFYAFAILPTLLVCALFMWWTAFLVALLLFLLSLLLLHSIGALKPRSLTSEFTEITPTADRLPSPATDIAHMSQRAGLGGARITGTAGFDYSAVFSQLLLLFGLLLLFVVEFVYIRDTFGNRMNTVFKLYYQAWVVIALGSAYLAQWLLTHLRSAPTRIAWTSAFSILFLGTLVYPPAAFATRTNHLQSEPTLDGLGYMHRFHQADAAAIDWLRENAQSDAIVVEAVGDQYSEFGRVSSQTGIPTLVGWGGHELQWRGSGDEAAKRAQDVQTIYTSPDVRTVHDLLNRYEVTHVFLGELERSKYGNLIPLAGFTTVVEKVYDQNGTSIYRVKSN